MFKRLVSDGILYDSSDAEEVAVYEKGYKSSFGWYRETLYKTEKGNWFLVGQGNGASKYANYDAHLNSSNSGNDLIVLQHEEAKTLLESYGEKYIDIYLKYFSVTSA